MNSAVSYLTCILAGCLVLLSFIQEGTFSSMPSHMIGSRPTKRATMNLETFILCLGWRTYLTYLSPASTCSTGTATVLFLCDVLSSPSVDAISVFTNTGVSRSCRDVVNPMSRNTGNGWNESIGRKRTEEEIGEKTTQDRKEEETGESTRQERK